MRTLAILLCSAALAACGGSPKPQVRVVYQTVEKPVPVACVPTGLRPKPEGFLTRDQAAKMDGPTRYAAIVADWLSRTARMNDTEPVIQGCRTVN